MSEKLNDVLNQLQGSSGKSRWITSWRRIAPENAEYADFPASVRMDLREAYNKLGITNLYSHQVKTYQVYMEGADTVVVTPTASGKTLCYNLPVLQNILDKTNSRALYVFPTKALARDQYHELGRMRDLLQKKFEIGVYDGDTPSGKRKIIRERCSVILTNPDMIHLGILPHHTKWQHFFKNVRTIVIDELHQYRGVFGSHLGNVIRRFLRICQFYGSQPRFILCSATLANPKELAAQITGRTVRLIDKSGAPCGARDFLFYNPPIVNRIDWIRRSYLAESVELACMFISAGIQTIVFTRSRLSVEIILKELKRMLKNNDGNNIVRGYRGGYLPSERREIEDGLRKGEILGVVSTSALEVGVDIGKLDVSILAGYPGTIASAWQRAGRAGRRESRAAAIYVASSAPLDQFIVQHPEYFFGASPEHGLVNPNNLLIFLDHIRCALFELPFTKNEIFGGVEDTNDFLSFLQEEEEAVERAGKWHYTGADFPAGKISLRSVSKNQFKIIDESNGKHTIIAEVDETSVPVLLHPEAIYLHEGSQYRVDQLDHESFSVVVSRVDTEYFTVPKEQSNVRIIETYESTSGIFPCQYGEVEVSSKVIGYRKLKFHTMENLGRGTVDLPEQKIITTGFWIHLEMGREHFDQVKSFRKMVNGLMGALTAIHSISSVVLMCDPKDIGLCITGSCGQWSAQADHLGSVDISSPDELGLTDTDVNIYIYDRYSGGIGLSEQLYKLRKRLIHSAYELVNNCSCKNGCPGCVGPVDTKGSSTKKIAGKILGDIRAGV